MVVDTARVGFVPRHAMALILALWTLALAIAFASPWFSTPAMAAKESCPEVSALEYPANPRGAIPTAKKALGTKGRVLEVQRGPDSTYGAAAKRACGVAVLRDSVYVVVHPIGMTCSACNLHAYVVRFRNGSWKVWTAY